MGQVLPAQDPVDGPDGRQRLYAKLFHFPVNDLSTAEQVLIVEIETNHLDDFLNLCRRVQWS
jgi:hypothetical protein